MDVSRATSALKESRFHQIRWVDETGSTNVDLLAEARNGAPEQVLGAEFQTAGRGRLGRTWEAPIGGSLLCSVLVRPSASLDPHLVTAALGLAAARAVEQMGLRRATLKWPNDLVAGSIDGVPDDRKLAGVLAESVVEHGRIVAVVAGIGINVNWPFGADVPAELVGTATSLRELSGGEVDRTDLLVELLLAFGKVLNDAESGREGVARIRAEVSDRSATLGRRVRVERPTDTLIGTATSIEPDGRLVVDVDGVTHVIGVGDVVHLRPIDAIE